MTGGESYPVVGPIVIGIGMLGFWPAAILGRSVPEITPGGIEIWFHISAQALTELVMITGGSFAYPRRISGGTRGACDEQRGI